MTKQEKLKGDYEGLKLIHARLAEENKFLRTLIAKLVEYIFIYGIGGR